MLMTRCDQQRIYLAMPLAKTVLLCNTTTIFICCLGMITLHHTTHIQVHLSSSTILLSTWHQIRNLVPVQAKDSKPMGHYGNDMISLKADIVDHKCSPLPRWPDRSCHLQMHHKCLQQHLERIQLCSGHFPPLPIQDLFPAQVGNPTWASQHNDTSRQLNYGKQCWRRCRPASFTGTFLCWIWWRWGEC